MDENNMVIGRKFDPGNNLVVLTVTGKLDLSEALQTATDTIEHPEFVPGMDSIWDLQAVDLSHISTTDLQTAEAQADRPPADQRGRASVVIVIADRLQYGIARMYLAHAGLEHLDYRIVNSMADAMKELGLAG